MIFKILCCVWGFFCLGEIAAIYQEVRKMVIELEKENDRTF